MLNIYRLIANSVIKMCKREQSNPSFVPQYLPALEEDVLKFKEFLNSNGKTLIMTGAGISTESGIPDYRSKGVGLYERSSRRPVTYQEFKSSAFRRKRYWLRNYVGWPRFSSVQPNIVHYTITNMEKLNMVTCIVTQNVDNLHAKAGSKKIIELHGTSYTVMCMNCDYSIDRHHFQSILEQLNPNVNITAHAIQPDGDVDINEDEAALFEVPDCPKCGGNLKPDVVFIGDNVRKEKVNNIKREVENCNSLLILGSSMSAFSAYRISLQASQLNKPICIINIGETRADDLAQLKIETRCGEILPKINLDYN